MRGSTMDLLAKAKQNPDMSDADWCRELGVNRTALSVARLRGRLSPTLAGNLARLLGENVGYWVHVAALEAEPDTYGKRKVISVLNL